MQSNKLKASIKQDDGDNGASVPQNPLMQQIAKLTGDNIDRKKFDLFSILLNKYARKFDSFIQMINASSRFSGGNPSKTIDKIYTLSGSIVETLEDLKADIEGDSLEKILASILIEWSNTYRIAKVNLIGIENFKHGVQELSVPAIKASLDQLKKAMATMSESLDAYSGYFKYAQNRDESNLDPMVKQDYSKLLNRLEDELYDISVITHMDFQTSADGMALIKEKMQGAILRTCDRLVTIIDPYIDPNSQQFIKNNAKIYNLLHDTSISAEAVIKLVTRMKSKEKLKFIIDRDLVKPLTQVIWLLGHD